MLAGAAWLVLALYESGLSAPLALAGTSGAAFLLAVLGERLLPYETAWREARGDVKTDLLGLVFSITLAGGLGQALAWLGAAPLADLLSARGLVWPLAWPLWLQVALALCLGEFGNYWVHRLQHERGGWLWELHAPHHSAPRLYWLNGNRAHPGDAFLSALLITVPLALFGAPERLLLLVGALSSAHLTMQHANIDYRVGPLTWMLSAAEAHRWHHAKDLRLANANYGAVLLVWDVLFGTRRLSAGRPPVGVGLPGEPDYPASYWGQAMAPWVRRNLAKLAQQPAARAVSPSAK
jgi:sterol desaturase/sphingolipid hydroxylase (fatty acid hydroxylase superfamily)